ADMTDLEQARRIVIESCEPLPSEPVNLERSGGRVLAEDVLSEIPIPPFDNSAMDGFAVRAADTAAAAPGAPARLALIGESRAGRPAERGVDPGRAIRVSTGAMLPEGADAVLRKEDATELDGSLETERRLEPGTDVRRAGEDIQPGDTVLTRGS